MSDAPDPVRYGRVTGKFVQFLADSPDEGNRPDELPLVGTVRLEPLVSVVRWPTASPPRTAVVSPVQCPIIGGILYPPGTSWGELPDVDGVFVIATDQPDAQPATVQWQAVFSFQGVTARPPNVVFEVPAGGVVDLSTVIPANPAPGVVNVVTTQVAERAEQAAQQPSRPRPRLRRSSTT